MPDNIPRLLRDVLDDAFSQVIIDGYEGFENDYHRDTILAAFGLTNAVVVLDLAAHDRAVREKLRWEIRAAVIAAHEHSGFGSRKLDEEYADGLADAILGPAPHTAPQAHEGDLIHD